MLTLTLQIFVLPTLCELNKASNLFVKCKWAKRASFLPFFKINPEGQLNFFRLVEILIGQLTTPQLLILFRVHISR